MNSETAEKPSERVLQSAMAAVTLDLRPVRRLPSNSVLVATATLLFLSFSLAISFALGWKALPSLSIAQRWLYYGTILGCGLLLSINVAPQLIPGAKRLISMPVAFLVPMVSVALCAAIIYPSSDLERFTLLGTPCLRTALLCAIGTGVVGHFVLRLGYLTTPFQTSISSALFGAFIGVAALALHCPVQNRLHVFVWHLGAPVLSALAVWAYWKLRMPKISA